MAAFGRYRTAWIAVLACATVAAAEPTGPLVGPPAPVASESKSLGGPAPSQSPRTAESPVTRGWMSQAIPLAAVVALVVGAGLVIRAAAKRGGALGMGGRSPAGILEVIGRYPVGRGATLMLLKLDRRVLLLSQSSMGKFGMGSQFSTLCEVTDPDEVASILVKARDAEGDSMSERFRSMLSRFDRNMDAEEGPPSGRRVTTGREGDRAEMWDATVPEQPAETGGAVKSLRRRLASIRWPEGGDQP